jgi:hypothetical protein
VKPTSALHCRRALLQAASLLELPDQPADCEEANRCVPGHRQATGGNYLV